MFATEPGAGFSSGDDGLRDLAPNLFADEGPLDLVIDFLIERQPFGLEEPGAGDLARAARLGDEPLPDSINERADAYAFFLGERRAELGEQKFVLKDVAEGPGDLGGGESLPLGLFHASGFGGEAGIHGFKELGRIDGLAVDLSEKRINQVARSGRRPRGARR